MAGWLANQLATAGSGLGVIPRTPVTGDHTILNNEILIAVKDTSAVVTVKLPAAGGLVDGEQHFVKDESGAADTNQIIVDGNGHNINGETTQKLYSFEGFAVYWAADTAEWFTL